MSKYCLIVLLLTVGSLADKTATACKLTVYKSPGQERLIGKSICTVFLIKKFTLLFTPRLLTISIIMLSLLSKLNPSMLALVSLSLILNLEGMTNKILISLSLMEIVDIAGSEEEFKWQRMQELRELSY